MSLDILALLKHPVVETVQYMDKVVFEVALRDAGCDDETVEDCLGYVAEDWDWIIKYFEGKK